MTQQRIDRLFGESDVKRKRQAAISNRFWRDAYFKGENGAFDKFGGSEISEASNKVLDISEYGGVKKIKKGIYVLDTSIAGVEEYEEILFRLILTESKTIITSIVNDELEMLKNRCYEPSHYAANNILWWIATNPEYFETVDIPKYGNYDDRIVDYCIAKGEPVLLTADKHMANDARCKGVTTLFFTNRDVEFENTRLKAKYVEGERIELPIATYRKDDGWYIEGEQFEKQDQSVLVVNESGTQKIRSGQVQLLDGMQVIWLKRLKGATYILHSRIDSVSSELFVTKVFEATVRDGMQMKNTFYQTAINQFDRKRLENCLN